MWVLLKSPSNGFITAINIGMKQNKDKTKKGTLPEDLQQNRYLAAKTVGDVWICYPWEAKDIDEHDEMAAKQRI